MEKSIKSIATNYGLYLGAGLALITLIIYAMKLELFANFWFGIILLMLMIVVGIISVAKVKQAQNGFASFKESFTSFFITILIAILISTVVSYVIFNIVDIDAAVRLKQITIEKSVEMMESFNAPIDVIDKAVQQMEEQDQYSIGNVIKGLAGNIVVMSIIGLIVAAAMKKNNLNEA